MWEISPAAVIPLHPVAGPSWDVFVAGTGKRADTFYAWNLSKCTLPFSVWEVSRPPWCGASAMQYQEDVYLLWFRDVQMMHSAPSFKPEQDWKPYVVLNCSLWGRESELHFCSSLNNSLRGSWVGLDSSKISDFRVVHNTHFQQKCPWGWTGATFHEKPLENSLWLSRERPNPPDVEARGRTLLAELLLVSGKELGKQGSE